MKNGQLAKHSNRRKQQNMPCNIILTVMFADSFFQFREIEQRINSPVRES